MQNQPNIPNVAQTSLVGLNVTQLGLLLAQMNAQLTFQQATLDAVAVNFAPTQIAIQTNKLNSQITQTQQTISAITDAITALNNPAPTA